MSKWDLLKSKRHVSSVMRVLRFLILVALVFPWSLVIGGIVLGKCV